MIRRVTAAVAAVTAGALLLSGCAGPTFEERCDALGGTVMADSTTRTVTGTVTGAQGTGVGTGIVTITVALCLDGDGGVLDMEVW